MSFLTKTRLFGKPAKLSQLGGYFFDLLFIFFLWGTVSGLRDLHTLNTHAASVTIPATTFVSFGALSIYGIRVASYVNMIRRNRDPQTIEWLVTIIPFVLALPCFIASGHLVKLDAQLHNYRFCYRETGRAPNYTFAAIAAACPPLPPDAIPY